VALLAGSSGAAAQESSAPVARGDVHFVLGWQNLHREQPQSHYNDWINRILYGGVSGGWYWTEHLKTQLDFGAGTEGEQFRIEPVTSGVVQTLQSSRLTVREQNFAIGQQYQFFHNQWFHPHVGAGVDIARETTTEHYDPTIAFDNSTRTSRLIAPERVEGPTSRVIARPFVETGFKAYMTRRAFFTSDMRLMVRGGIDEVLFRLGFGIDF